MRILKTWAKARGIYSANFGYLNGITITIMLALVDERLKYSPTSQLMINCEQTQASLFDLEVQTLFEAFFSTFSKWDWCNSNPVTLVKVYTPEDFEDMQKAGAGQEMPVLTSIYPYRCTTH